MKEIIRFSPLCTVRELLQLYRIRALKKLSQNFLLDLRLTNKIAKAAGSLTNCEVCEVGPGPGSITRSIMLQRPSKLTVIEKDVRFKPILEELASTSICKFDIIIADILDFDLAGLFDNSLKKEWEDESPNIHLIGNLPFNVSTPLIIRWLKDISLKRSAWVHGRVPMTLTFQEEVAERMIAPIFSKSRCRLSVMCQNWCKVTHLFSIPGRAFLPKPKVDVGVVRFEPLLEPVIPLEFHFIEKTIRTVFSGRQKFVYKTAGQLFPKALRNDLVQRMLSRADVSREVRPVQISIEDWKRLCLAYKEICDEDPRLYSYDYRGRKATREHSWAEDNNDEDDSDEESENEWERTAVK